MTHVASVALRWYDQQVALRHQAAHDALTGIANRRRFHDALRDGGPAAALLLIDLDRFKPVNDTYGHAAGDLVLQEVAQRLQASARDDDLVARLGGDEFAVLCSTSTSTDAIAIAERFLETLEAPIDVGEATVSISASIGIAAAPLSELSARADAALYEAKAGGGRRVVAHP